MLGGSGDARTVVISDSLPEVDEEGRLRPHTMDAPEWAFTPPDHESEHIAKRPFVPTLLDLTKPPPEPQRLHRLLYVGGFHALQGEPGCGKSWLALWLAGQVVEGGHGVVYLDEEGGADLVTERLVALDVDPDAVTRRFRYFPFEGRRWDDDDLVALDQLVSLLPNAQLAVFDSLPDFLAAAGRSEDSAHDVTVFVGTVVRRFLAAGIAVLVLDHLRKPDQDVKRRSRSRYARGSGAKLAKPDVSLLLETATVFDATTSGRLQLWKTKDRRGRLDLPWVTSTPLELAVDVVDGKVSIAEGVTERAQSAPWDGPTSCMEAVLGLLRAAAPEEFSGRKLCERMRVAGHPFRDSTIKEAAERLAGKQEVLYDHGEAEAGAITVRNGPRGSRLYRWSSEGENTQEVPLDEDF